MENERLGEKCCICSEAKSGTATVCALCERAFGPILNELAYEETPLDLEKYGSRSFPWEPLTYQPTLIISNRAWMILALGLVVLVLLLALLRTPLPSCWEISS
jgi:hypothetical protein